jgi:enoyl-CoA hydratase/carnithine racemase
MPLSALPRGAAYLKLSNPSKRNALSMSILQDLKEQIIGYNTSRDGELQLLPRRNADLRSKLPEWLTHSETWKEQRGHQPKVLVLRSEGPVFCSGHDLKEMKENPRSFTNDTFELCAEVMGLIKASPIPIVCPIQGRWLNQTRSISDGSNCS